MKSNENASDTPRHPSPEGKNVTFPALSELKKDRQQEISTDLDVSVFFKHTES